MGARRDSAAVALAPSEPPELDEAVEAIRTLALAAGIRPELVARDELRRGLARMSCEALRAAPEKYARDLADFQAMGLDLNDPTLWEGDGLVVDAGVLHYLETGEAAEELSTKLRELGHPCGSSS